MHPRLDLRRSSAYLLILGLALAGCSNSVKTSAPPSPSATAVQNATPPPPPPPPPAPLTGLPSKSKTYARRPILAIKIDNAVAARPHVGLDKADIVYEEPVEGGITRFIAIFQSRDATTVGPIRSARLADIDVLAQYGRVPLAYSGAARYVLDALDDANLVLLPHGRYGSIYWRNRGRRAPHNLFSSTVSLSKAARRSSPQTPPTPLFTFGDLIDPPSASSSPSPSPDPSWPSGERVRIPFSSSSWTAVWKFHAGSGLYRRSHGSVPHRTANGKRVTARNIIVMRVPASVGGRRDKAGNTTPQLELVGSGQAVLLRDGVRIKGRWTRTSLTQPTIFTDAEDRPFVLAPGNTWIELVPTRIKPSYS